MEALNLIKGYRKNIEFTSQDLKRLIVPLVLEQTLLMFVGIVDTMMVSKQVRKQCQGWLLSIR